MAAAVMLAISAGAAQAATQPAPQPFSPVNGAITPVNPSNGIPLLIRATVANPVYVEAWRDGGSVLVILASQTSDVTIRQATVGPVYFTASAPDSLYSGPTGTVYWRPRSQCANEETFVVSPCTGETQSFVYTLPGAAPAPPPPPPLGPGSNECAKAKQLQKKARTLLNVAQRRYHQARTQREARQWKNAVIRGRALYGRTRHNAEVACG